MADPSDLFEEFHPFPFFSPDPGSDSESEPDNPLSLDLFCRRRRGPSSSSPPPSTMEPPDFLGLTLGLGLPNHEDEVSDRRDRELGHTLGLGFPNQEDDVSDRRDHELGHDWSGDEFFIGRRAPRSSSRLVDEDGLRILGFESDDDDEERIVAISEAESSLPLCWDCLRLDEGEVADDFEWEEIDTRAEERDIITPMFDDENEGENAATVNEERPNGIIREFLMQGDETPASNWEVLLTMYQFGNPSADSHVVDDLDYADGFFVYTSEYDEVLFGQFQEHEGSIKGSPPAARSVVEGLPTVVLRMEDVGESYVSCAVCKDDISFEEKAKKLPCCHYYHEECILPWLGMRNTCPLCRYELPTDDVEYESRKVGRAGNNGG